MKNELREMIRQYVYGRFETITRVRVEQVMENIRENMAEKFDVADFEAAEAFLLKSANGEAIYPADRIDPAIEDALDQIAYAMAKNFAQSMMSALLLQKMMDEGATDTSSPPRYMN